MITDNAPLNYDKHYQGIRLGFPKLGQVASRLMCTCTPASRISQAFLDQPQPTIVLTGTDLSIVKLTTAQTL